MIAKVKYKTLLSLYARPNRFVIWVLYIYTAGNARQYNKTCTVSNYSLLRSIVMSTTVCVCVCLSVCLQGYLRHHSRDLYHFCACCLWPWIGPPPASWRYVMYFRFICRWHHVFCIMGRIAVWISLWRTDFAYIYFFTAKSDIIQLPVIKGYNFDQLIEIAGKLK